MAAYHKVEVSLNTNAVEVGIPSPQTVSVTLPTVGPQGPQGPKGDKGDPGEVSGSIAWDNVTSKPSTFAPSAHAHPISEVTGLQTALDGKQASGTYATLVGGTVPANQLPSYVDDVIEVANAAARPNPGETGKIYITTDNNKVFRWSGSAYVEIVASPGSTDAVPEGTTNLYHTTLRAAAAAPVQSVAGRTGTVILDGSDLDTSGNDDSAAFFTYEFADGNGLYYPLPESTLNNKRVYRNTTGHHVFFQSLRWHITDGSPITANIIESSDDDNAAWPWLSAWDGSIEKAKLSTIVGRARSTFLFVGDSIPNTSVSGLGTAAAADSTAFAAASHTHGNLTNDGKIGTTSGLPLRTGTNGVIEAGSFGTSAGTFCEGNDTRLSDDRDPNLHAASHLPEGADEIFDQSLNTGDDVEFNKVFANEVEAVGGGAKIDFLEGEFVDQNGREAFNWQALEEEVAFYKGIKFVDNEFDTADNYKALTRDNLGLGTAAVEDATTFAASGSITTSGLTQATARLLGRTTASTGAVEEIQIGSGLSLSAGELSATGSGVTAVGASTADVLSVSGSDLVADDPNADRIVFWDDSEGKWRYLEAGSGLSISGTTMTATASGGSKTYAVFTAEHNQPPATSFATLDTRNSIAVLDFDDASTESAVFVGIMPEGASLGSGLIVNLDFMATTATSGNVRWSVAFERCNTDLDSDSFDTATAATVAVASTSGVVAVGSITCTAIDSIAAGDLFRLRVQRLGADSLDSASGDIELVAVEVRSAA
jgi:hypothetical protein